MLTARPLALNRPNPSATQCRRKFYQVGLFLPGYGPRLASNRRLNASAPSERQQSHGSRRKEACAREHSHGQSRRNPLCPTLQSLPFSGHRLLSSRCGPQTLLPAIRLASTPASWMPTASASVVADTSTTSRTGRARRRTNVLKQTCELRRGVAIRETIETDAYVRAFATKLHSLRLAPEPGVFKNPFACKQSIPDRSCLIFLWGANQQGRLRSSKNLRPTHTRR